ncbi:MAG: hypothetical protein REI93_11700, partial [Pedobacter sp.]|nr:hypothetical protein [Pedobacter sp.]
MPKSDLTSAERYKAFRANLPAKAEPVVPLYQKLFEEAKSKKHWIYDPQIKRWQSPEEFLELEKRYIGGETERLSRLQIKDPM